MAGMRQYFLECVCQASQEWGLHSEPPLEDAMRPCKASEKELCAPVLALLDHGDRSQSGAFSEHPGDSHRHRP